MKPVLQFSLSTYSLSICAVIRPEGTPSMYPTHPAQVMCSKIGCFFEKANDFSILRGLHQLSELL